jgi:putative acetyltransferase
MRIPSWEIRIDDLSGSEVIRLLDEHMRAMEAVSPPESRHALSLDELRAPDVTFWTLWDGDSLVGGGALKQVAPSHGEIKSMRTAPSYLRKGAGAFLLRHIIAEAKRRGYGRLSL